ncbi:Glycerophosphoryl diester phosphodiesterase (fragment) [Flavobacterium psychrophilum]
MSSDNELRVIHNQTIDRATKGFGFVKKKNTFVALKEFGIPIVTEVLNY